MKELFIPGKITFVLDGGAGSSGKGNRGANMWKYHRSRHTTFSTNTFMENAAHTITYSDGREFIFQCLASVTGMDGLEKQYLGPGCVFAAETFLSEIEKHNLKPNQVGIHPNVAIVTRKDIDYERGLVDFEGHIQESQDSSNLTIGSTLHGVGAARARRLLRRTDALLARDVPELKSFLCDTQFEIMDRLNRGESGLGEIAQGYQLSLFSQFYPRTTSRNCTVSAALDDSMLPPVVAGPVVVNMRTYPIRVNNNKYVDLKGNILTWDQFNALAEDQRRIVNGNSGGCYPDQHEITWDELSAKVGKKIFESTSLTKLPRRCYTFSKQNLLEALRFNNTGHGMYVSVNFMNYVDPEVQGKWIYGEVMTPTVRSWWNQNIKPVMDQFGDVDGYFIGTWKTIDDSVFVPL